MTERLHFHFSLSCIGEGNGNPLQCSCPENPREGGAWWAAVYGVAQSRTRLKWLSSSIVIKATKCQLLPLLRLLFYNLNLIVMAFDNNSKSKTGYSRAHQFSSVAQSCLTLCEPRDCSVPGFPLHHQLLELAQTCVLWVDDAIQPSHPPSSHRLLIWGYHYRRKKAVELSINNRGQSQRYMMTFTLNMAKCG